MRYGHLVAMYEGKQQNTTTYRNYADLWLMFNVSTHKSKAPTVKIYYTRCAYQHSSDHHAFDPLQFNRQISSTTTRCCILQCNRNGTFLCTFAVVGMFGYSNAIGNGNNSTNVVCLRCCFFVI
eukprot:787495_1